MDFPCSEVHGKHWYSMYYIVCIILWADFFLLSLRHSTLYQILHVANYDSQFLGSYVCMYYLSYPILAAIVLQQRLQIDIIEL